VPDPVTTARSARESLARGLSALQAEHVPPGLVELAEPIAEAMGALHQIERSKGQTLLPHAEVALNHTRGALSQLQAHAQTHPAVMAATEAVASSLGLVHALAKMAKEGVSTQQAFGQPAPVSSPYRPGAGPASAGSPLAATFATNDPFAPGAALAKDGSQRPPSPPMPAAAVPIISADLGTHSPTNFYKGLSGNDIIDHGGLFVSTYMIPKIGTPVRLKISLPGGYEFEANGVVRWSREASEGGGGAPPGFGAQLTGITQEARQLVYRYARNREPLFHDDL
jgi:hypothetical protein